jgi:hypothetical protein
VRPIQLLEVQQSLGQVIGSDLEDFPNHCHYSRGVAAMFGRFQTVPERAGRARLLSDAVQRPSVRAAVRYAAR